MNHCCSIFEKLLDVTVTYELISFVSLVYLSQKMRITLHVSACMHWQIYYLSNLLVMQEEGTTEAGFVSRSLSNIHGILWRFWGNFQKSLEFAAGNLWRMCTLIYSVVFIFCDSYFQCIFNAKPFFRWIGIEHDSIIFQTQTLVVLDSNYFYYVTW